MKEFNSADYERMMVEAAGGWVPVKSVVQNGPVKPESDNTVHFVVQNDFSFRDSFFDLLVRRGAAVRIVG